MDLLPKKKKKEAFPVAVVSHLLLAATDIRKLWVTAVSQSGSIITRGLHGHERAPRDAIIKDKACRSELSADVYPDKLDLKWIWQTTQTIVAVAVSFGEFFFFFFLLSAPQAVISGLSQFQKADMQSTLYFTTSALMPWHRFLSIFYLPGEMQVPAVSRFNLWYPLLSAYCSFHVIFMSDIELPPPPSVFSLLSASSTI